MSDLLTQHLWTDQRQFYGRVLLSFAASSMFLAGEVAQGLSA